MNSYLRIRHLRIVGISKSYDVRFRDGLNIIAGEISTGKTAILGFIDYCLGAKEHPEHLEVQRKARSCLLEFELAGTTYVIERALFSSRGSATIHQCKLSELAEPHPEVEVASSQVPDRESISSFILRKLGLWELELKEAPTRDSSGTDRMSFRDLMWFCHLPNRRLDGGNLLFEREYPKNLKFPQVFDILFGVYVDRLATLGRQINKLTSERNLLERDIEILGRFLKERSVPDQDELTKRDELLKQEIASLQAELEQISADQRTDTDVVSGLRRRQLELADRVENLSAQVRDRETLLKRLLPLRGQYSEEIKKYHFLQESQRLLDPFGVVQCPVCGKSVASDDHAPHQCFLCGSEPPSEKTAVDVNREIRALETRLKELNGFIADTEEEALGLRNQAASTNRDLQEVSSHIGSVLRNYVSPVQARRDEILESLGRLQQEIRDVGSSLSFWQSLDARQMQLVRIVSELKAKQAELEQARMDIPDRGLIVGRFSDRFGSILRQFKFPKLSDPLIDSQLTPHVRSLPYQKISSSGASTLISLAWYLAMFSLAVEVDANHPGFLMIDSPQKNIGTYKVKGRDRNVETEYRDDAIVTGIYETLVDLCVAGEARPQLIVVDNAPPSWVEDYVCVRYTGTVGHYPYGLIDDEEEG